MKTDWVIITQVKGQGIEFELIGFDNNDGAVCFEESGAFKKLIPGATESQNFEDTPKYRYVFFNGPYLDGNFPVTKKFTEQFFKTIEVNRGAFIHIGGVNQPVEDGLDHKDLKFINCDLSQYFSKKSLIPYSLQAPQNFPQNEALKKLEELVRKQYKKEKTDSNYIDEMHQKIIAAWDKATRYYSDIRIKKYIEILFPFRISFGILKSLKKNDQGIEYAKKVNEYRSRFSKEDKDFCEEVEKDIIKSWFKNKSLIEVMEALDKKNFLQDDYNSILNSFCNSYDFIRPEYIKILEAR